MPGFPNRSRSGWRRILLTIEFSSLALLLIAMAALSHLAGSGKPVASLWLLVPALASLGVFASFIGLMYLRWVAAADVRNPSRQKLLFTLLAITMLAVWVYAIISTWLSLTPS